MTIKFSDITGGGIPYGNNAGRPVNPAIGKLYSNGEERRLELYTNTGWQNIVAETPGVISIAGNYIAENNTSNITINGTNFTSGAIAYAVGTNGAEVAADTTTVNSIVQITAVFSGLSSAYEPYGIKVQNPSNLYGLLPDVLYVNETPVWNTAPGSLGTAYDIQRSDGYSFNIGAVDPDGTTLTQTISSGTIPAGMSFNQSTGVLSGIPSAVLSDTTYSFTVQVTDGVITKTRSYSFTVKAPVVQAFSYTGSDQTFTVPSGLTKVFAKVWGAAGGAGQSATPGGKGGAGGFSRANISVTPGQNLAIVVGAGGTRNDSGVTNTLIYGHKTAPTGRFGGQGASGGAGGGLSGIFNGTFTFANSLLISGAGGGGSAYQSGTLGRGGHGGGANSNGGDGDPQAATGTANGRGGTLTAGGKTGAFYFKSTNGNGQGNDSIDGGQLYGGHASTYSSWTEGGGGGSGYYGGGPGNHDSEGGNWGNGGGGSGYANLTFCSSVESYSATKDTLASQATSDPHYVSGIGASVTGSTGGNGRVVLVY